MPVLDTLSKLAGLASSVRAGRGEGGISSDFKYIRAQQQAMEAKKLENLKYITGRYTDLYFKANDNRALQENVLETMNNMKRSLPPVFREQFDLFTKAGPFSESKEKLRRWTEINGEGPRSLTDEEKQDPMTVAMHGFEAMDYGFAQRDFVLPGSLKGIEKSKIVALPDGNIAYREKEGMLPFIMTAQEFGLLRACEVTGTNYGEALANNGKRFGTETYTKRSGGEEVTYKNSYNLLRPLPLTGKPKEGEKPSLKDYNQTYEILKTTPIDKTGKDLPKMLDPILTMIMLKDTNMGETTGKLSMDQIIAQKVLDAMDDRGGKSLEDDQQILNEELRKIPSLAGYHFIVTDSGYDQDNWYDFSYGFSKNAKIVPVPGEFITLNSSDGQPVNFIYDKNTNTVYDADGISQGGIEQAEAKVVQRTYQEVTGKAPAIRTAVPTPGIGATPSVGKIVDRIVEEFKPVSKKEITFKDIGRMFPTKEAEEHAKVESRKELLAFAKKIGTTSISLGEMGEEERRMWQPYIDIINWLWGSYSNFIGSLKAGQAKATKRLGE